MTDTTPRELAAFDAAVAAELPRVSHVEYDSHEICKHFAGKVRERLVALTQQAEGARTSEVTEEMLTAGKRMLHNSNGRGAREKVERIYRAMHAATPPSPSAEPAKTRSEELRDAGFTRRPSWKNLPGAIDGDDDAQPSGEVLTEAEIRSAVLSVGPEASGRVSMTYDSGPYEVTKITYIGERICRAVERATLAKIGGRK